jgi:hypothetical protein
MSASLALVTLLVATARCSSSDFDLRENAQSLAAKELACDSVVLDGSGQIQNPDGSIEERYLACGCGKLQRSRLPRPLIAASAASTVNAPS